MPKTSAACGTVIKTGTSLKLLYIFITSICNNKRDRIKSVPPYWLC